MNHEADYNTVKKFDIVKREVANYYGVTEFDLVHGGSFSKFVFARRIAMYISLKLFATRAEIANSFSCGYDNICYSIRTVESLMQTNMFSTPKVYGYLSGEVLRTMSIYKRNGISL